MGSVRSKGRQRDNLIDGANGGKQQVRMAKLKEDSRPSICAECDLFDFVIAGRAGETWWQSAAFRR